MRNAQVVPPPFCALPVPKRDTQPARMPLKATRVLKFNKNKAGARKGGANVSWYFHLNPPIFLYFYHHDTSNDSMSPSAQPRAVLRGHEADVQALDFDHSERFLISGYVPFPRNHLL